MMIALWVLLLQASTPQSQLPQPDIRVEIIGNLPLELKLQDVTQLLGRRRVATAGSRRVYLPTILELIMLVEGNPARPRGRLWESIGALNMKYNAGPKTVTVEYCIDHCDFDTTGAFNPKREMVSYTAPEKDVTKRADKQLQKLQKYAER